MSVLCSCGARVRLGWLALSPKTSTTLLIFCPVTSRDISNGDQLFLALCILGSHRCGSFTAVPASALMGACSLLF